MSVLLLDIGNTRLKWVGVTAPGAPPQAMQAHVHDGDALACIAALSAQWRLLAPQRVLFTQVMGAETGERIATALREIFSVDVRAAYSSAECGGLRSAYAAPERLGVDRWLAMLALWHRRPGPFCVASAGTALTVDAVSAQGEHLGGVIAPGVAAMVESTLGRTRFAVGAMPELDVDALGRSTEDCVRQGALQAAAGLLDRLATRHPGLHVLAGGDAGRLATRLDTRWQLEPDLVLHGLSIWALLKPVD